MWNNETEPLDTMKNLISNNWAEYKYTPKPYEIMVQNEEVNPVSRFDLNLGDVIIIRMDGTEQIRQRSNFQYFDRIFPIAIEFYTKNSRGRLRNMGKMIRAICEVNKHNFGDYQLIRLKGYIEMVEENLNIWKGIQMVQVESAALCQESPL